MAGPDHSSTVEAILRIKNEIQSLTAQQSKALEDAVYVGMTAEDSKHYEHRRQEISHLAVQLAELERAL